MGNFAGSLGGHFTLHTDVFEVATNIGANTSTVRTHTYITCDSTSTGVWNLTGSSSWGASCNGNGNGGNFNYDFRGNANTIDLNSYDTVVGHDANGNASIGWSGSANMQNSPYVTTAGTGGGLGLSRLPLAPSIAGIGVNSITSVSAHLTLSLNNYGHGTSGNANLYVRPQGSSSWTDLGNQGYTGGNVWVAAGLTPGVTYEYIANTWNNNGDFSQSGIQTFETLPVSGMLSVMAGLL